MTSSSNILQASTKQVVMNNGLYYARVIVQCFNSNVTPGLPNTTKSTYIRIHNSKTIPSIQQYATYMTAKRGALNKE